MILGIRLIKQLIQHYVGQRDIQIHIFTDTDVMQYLSDKEREHVVCRIKNHKSWVDATNDKFSSIIDLENVLGETNDDFCFYLDADTAVYRDFYEEFMLGNLVGGEHYNNCDPMPKPYERRIESLAYIPFDTPYKQTYYYGAFFGGVSRNVVTFCKKLRELQVSDKIEPVWNDESYINYLFHYDPPAKTVSAVEFGKVFGVSNKGGLENTRESSKRITEDILSTLRSNREKQIRIENGIVSVI